MTGVVLPGKVKQTIEMECTIYRVDGTVKDHEVSRKEYIVETKEVEE